MVQCKSRIVKIVFHCLEMLIFVFSRGNCIKIPFSNLLHPCVVVNKICTDIDDGVFLIMPCSTISDYN